MLGTKQRPGVSLVGVTDDDLDAMQDMIDDADGHFNSPQVATMLGVAHSDNRRSVDLVEEGWHQLEQLRGKKWLHITLFHSGVKYHCYTSVSGPSDSPMLPTHQIESISYVSFTANRSNLIEVLRT
jgi:hypothetical protein